jgi:hypothetical protein
MPRLLPGILIVLFVFALPAGAAAEVVDSTFINYGPWNDPFNWDPAEVPNNTGSKSFNVAIPSSYVSLTGAATISNLTVEGAYTALIIEGALTVLETTTNSARFGLDDEDSHGIELYYGGNLVAGTLSSFADGTLSGKYRLFEGSAAAPTTLQFNGADIRQLSNAVVSLAGAFSRIVDENGLDGLRNFREVGPGSRFNVSDRHFVAPGDFTNDGTLNIGQLHLADASGPASFTVAGSLTNFDAVTNTLQGGIYRFDSEPSESVLRFPGANIVNNAARIFFQGSLCRIVDQFGNDALRHFAHNLAGGEFRTNQGFTTEGDFTNDGTLFSSGGKTFKVTGRLTNFAPETKTLTGGTYAASSAGLQFPGADIVHNAASIRVLSDDPVILDENGDDGLRNLGDNGPTGSFAVGSTSSFTTKGNFTNAGTLTVEGDRAEVTYVSSFQVPAGFQYTQTGGQTIVGGTLVAESMLFAGGVLRGEAGALWGNVTIGDATIAPSGRWEVQGSFTLTANSRFRYQVKDFNRSQLSVFNGPSPTIDGTLEVEIQGDFLPSGSDVYVVISTWGSDTGRFVNAPDGSRLLTADGKGSFLVTYTQNGVWLSAFEPVPRPAQLLNISTRAQVLTGDKVIIGGFIIRGTVPKRIAVRGIGPSLSQANVVGALQDPTLELYDSNGVTVGSNNNWSDTQAAEIAQLGLAPADLREAVLVTTLEPGSYTVALRGLNQITGIGVIEVYDLTASPTSKIANISTRAQTGAAENVLIGGFIAGGEGPGNAQIVVRAIGPELKNWKVADAVSDPTLELRNSNGGLVAANDDYSEWPQGIGAGLEPADQRSSALRITVPAGNYTAIVRGKNEAAGTALVEVYDLVF